MKSRSLTRGSLLVVIGLLAASCAQASEPLAESGNDVAIPSDWTTYSGETGAFSISYPGDWEVFALDEAATADFFANIDEVLGITSDPVISLSVGLPAPGGGFQPNVTVTVESIPEGLDLGQYVDGNLQGLDVVFPSYASTGRTDAVLRGVDGVLMSGSYELADLLPDVDGRWWMVQLFLTDGMVGWSVTCGTTEAATAPGATDLDTCDSVLRTFDLSGS